MSVPPGTSVKMEYGGTGGLAKNVFLANLCGAYQRFALN